MAAAVALVGVAACGSSNTTGTDTVSLAGNYTLQSFSEGGQAVPQTTGTLTMTGTNYLVNIAGAVTLVDSGTYTATSAGAFTQTSTVLGGLQSVGTYTLANDTLTVNVSAQGVTVAQTWLKQ
ncbi:MAG: hypothetical protein ACRENQ_15400 [Gemmatimonadaceae bacterium]